MFEFDEPVEQGAIVRVIGVGTFGLRVVGNMVGRIHHVECFGVVKKDSAGPDTPAHLERVEFVLVAARRAPQLLRNGDGYVEVGDGQE